MKTHRLVLTLASTLLLAGSPLRLAAADVAVDISSYNPHNADTVLRQIDLNVAIKLYEKARTELQEDPIARAEIEGAMRRSAGAAEEGKARLEMLEMKRQVLEVQENRLRDKIRELIEEANAEQAKLAPKISDAGTLQGTWEGVEVGREGDGKCTLTVNGEAMSFQGANRQEWYKTTFALPGGTEPKQLRATITDCPAPEFVGKSALSIFKLEGGKLTLSGHAPGSTDVPKSFEGDPDARTFVFKKAQQP